MLRSFLTIVAALGYMCLIGFAASYTTKPAPMAAIELAGRPVFAVKHCFAFACRHKRDVAVITSKEFLE